MQILVIPYEGMGNAQNLIYIPAHTKAEAEPALVQETRHSPHLVQGRLKRLNETRSGLSAKHELHGSMQSITRAQLTVGQAGERSRRCA